PPGASDVRDVHPVAQFNDTTPPMIADLAATSSQDGVYTVDWKVYEAGVTATCYIDGASPRPCAPGDAFPLAPGPHNVTIMATDLNHNPAVGMVSITAIDTTLDGLTATTDGGTTVECSLDGGPWTACRPLPALADGEHTLKARGRNGTFVDLTPAVRTWTVDTKAPDTFLEEAPGGFKLTSDEAGVSFR